MLFIMVHVLWPPWTLVDLVSTCRATWIKLKLYASMKNFSIPMVLELSSWWSLQGWGIFFSGSFLSYIFISFYPNSCASAIADYFPKTKNHKKILVLCGPGNNGGDGLVCARHLKCFGFNSEIFYPKQPPKDLFLNLTKQCNMCDIPFLESCPTEDEMTSNYSLIVDALFGFSFTPPIRAQFVEIIRNIANTSTPVCSIDIPSGE